MAVESADDRAIFLSANDFGVTATIGGSSVTGIFDNDFVEVDAGGGVPFAVQQPRFLARTADVSSVSEGTAATISGTSYKVAVRQDDGTGMTTLVLEKQ
jgi:hypothetical protein